MDARKNWSEQETILAFYYYYLIPYGQISTRNEKILEIAQLIGRTPGAVAKKMFNLASHDPEMIDKHILGLQHSSKLDEIIVKKYVGDWANLANEALAIEAELQGKSVAEVASANSDIISTEETGRSLEDSISDTFFRDMVFCSYNNTCCISGVTDQRLLVASHIKPWRASKEKAERVDPRNGLCLNGLHALAFDTGLFTILPDYTVRLSSSLNGEDEGTRWLKQFDKQAIILPEKFLPKKEFLEYHNDVVFVA